jgi:hypothetical protein
MKIMYVEVMFGTPIFILVFILYFTNFFLFFVSPGTSEFCTNMNHSVMTSKSVSFLDLSAFSSCHCIIIIGCQHCAILAVSCCKAQGSTISSIPNGKNFRKAAAQAVCWRGHNTGKFVNCNLSTEV